MSSRPILSRHSLPDHAIVKIRVAFDPASSRGFHELVAELVDATGVVPGTSPPYAASTQVDLALVSVDEDIYSSSGKRGTAEFAIPEKVFCEKGSLPLIIAIATYGSVYRFVREYQVIDLEFPSDAAQLELVGPKFGPNLVATQHGSVRLGLILKPRFISNEQRLRTLVRSVACVGIDYITDDELTVGTPELPFERRIEIVMEELRHVERECGKKVPFIANITGSYSSAMSRATAAHNAGVRAIMVNTIAMGYDVVCDLACNPSCTLGIVANSVGRGVMTSGGYRIAPEVLCKLARLAGADAVYTGPFVGTIDTMEQHAEKYRTALTQPYHRSCRRKHAAAVMSGGLGLPEIIRNEQLYRGDLFLSLGRDFIRPLDGGIEASVLLECVRLISDAIRNGGLEEGRKALKQLNARKAQYRDCLRAIRAEEAMK
jgi:ribulose 1,5-bisphosphate carboxylase large subunit-like protein